MTDSQPAPPSLRRVGRDVLWRLIDGEGLDHCRLLDLPEGPSLAGTVVTVEAGQPCTISYLVRCDRFWHTREVYVTAAGAQYQEQSRDLVLIADGDGNWYREPARGGGGNKREQMPAISGCLDIDLAFTPATNTLPIRRLDQAIGAKVAVGVAWVQFPSMEISTISQEYLRLERSRFRYYSFTHNFAAMLDIDDAGLVRTYEGLWDRVAETDIEDSVRI